MTSLRSLLCPGLRTPLSRARFLLWAAVSGVLVFLAVTPKPWLVELPASKNVPYTYFLAIYGWWGGLLALAGLLVLLAGARFWVRPLPTGVLDETEAARARTALVTPRWFWLLVALAMLATAVTGAQRLNHSLWDDESYTLRRFVQGDYKRQEDGTVVFRERGLGVALHDYRRPNNHILHSVLARGSVGVWKWFRDPNGLPFSEAALRFPAYLFGIASVGALAWMLKEMGLARAGVLAAFLLAAHPWHMRYASEARGYSMVLFFLPLLAVFWMRALRTAAWRWWIAFAATEFALLYTYPAMIYPVVAFNIFAVLLILVRRPLEVPPAVPLMRWLVCSAVAGLAFVWLFLPCVPQMKAYVDSGDFMRPMGWSWVQDMGSHLLAGAPWFKSGDLSSPYPELYKMAHGRPVLFIIVLSSAVVLTCLGIVRWLRRGWLSAGLVFILTLPALASFAAAYRSGFLLFEWYLIYLLVGLVAFLASGADSLSWPWRSRRWNAVLPVAAVVVFLAAYLVLVNSAHRWLLTRGIQPMREIALAARGTLLPNYPGHDKVVTLGWPVHLYDPHFVEDNGFEEFISLVRQADREGKTVYVQQVGQPEMNWSDHCKIFLLCARSRYFEMVADLPAYERMLDRFLVRYVPGSLEKGLPTAQEWQDLFHANASK